jgi:hypothetical protein
LTGKIESEEGRKRPGKLAQVVKRDNERGRIEADVWGMH